MVVVIDRMVNGYAEMGYAMENKSVVVVDTKEEAINIAKDIIRNKKPLWQKCEFVELWEYGKLVKTINHLDL